MRAASRRRGDPPSRHIEHSARSEHHARQPGSARVVRARAATLQMKFGRCRRLHKGVKVSLARKKDWIALTEGDLESHERGCARGARAHCLRADRMHGSESDLLPHHHVLTDRARSPALHVQYASPPGLADERTIDLRLYPDSQTNDQMLENQSDLLARHQASIIRAQSPDHHVHISEVKRILRSQHKKLKA